MRRIPLAAPLALAAGLAGLAAALPAAAQDSWRAGALVVSGAYAFETPPVARAAGGYLSIENTGAADDRLLSASSDRGMAQIHRSETDAAGVARMVHQADGVPLPAGETVTLAPGGLHLMFMGLDAPFAAGETVAVTLTFETAGALEIALPVVPRGAAPAGMGHGSGHGTAHGTGHGG